MSLYVLKGWGDDDLIIDEIVEALDDASAIEIAKQMPLPVEVTKAELRNNVSFAIWKWPSNA